MNIFFNTFYFCSFFFKGAGLRAGPPGLKLGLQPGPPINGLGPGLGQALACRAGPGLKRAAGRGLFGDPYVVQ